MSRWEEQLLPYCIQDCELCINLTLALDIIPNNMLWLMYVLFLNHIFILEVKGLKSFSLISRVCNSKGVRIPTLVNLLVK